jgi:hypothetical protein
VNCGERDEALAEGVGGGGVTPTESPVSFSTNTWECLDSLKESCMFRHVWDPQCSDQQRVVLCVNVLHCDDNKRKGTTIRDLVTEKI